MLRMIGGRVMDQQGWEYTVGTFSHPTYYHGSEATRQYLDEMGAARWELVQVLTFPHPGDAAAGLVFYWKRPREA